MMCMHLCACARQKDRIRRDLKSLCVCVVSERELERQTHGEKYTHKIKRTEICGNCQHNLYSCWKKIHQCPFGCIRFSGSKDIFRVIHGQPDSTIHQYGGGGGRGIKTLIMVEAREGGHTALLGSCPLSLTRSFGVAYETVASKSWSPRKSGLPSVYAM